MRRARWWRFGLLFMAGVVGLTAATVGAAAVNVATGGRSSWLPAIEDHPLWWAAGAILVGAVAGVGVWWAQRMVDVRLAGLVPVKQRPEAWVVDRPAEVGQVVAALRRRRRTMVGITTAVHGAGGFGKTTVAKLVGVDRKVLRRFPGGVFWVTLGRDRRTPSTIVEKINDLIARLDLEHPVTFTDPQQAGAHLAALLAVGPRRLLILDDVWYPQQEAAFPVGGQSARLITTRIPSLVGGVCVPVRVDQMTREQAHTLLTAGLSPLPSPGLVAGLVAQTGRWPLLLRLANKVLLDQVKTDLDVDRVARGLLERIRRQGAMQLDRLTGAAELQQLDVNDPQQRQHAVAATIEASAGLLTPKERQRFAELAIFAEDENVPVALIGQLWNATGGLDVLATRALCARLDELALLTLTGDSEGGAVNLHDVIRDFLLTELGTARVVALHRALLQAITAGLPPTTPGRSRRREYGDDSTVVGPGGICAVSVGPPH